ncbi:MULTISPECIES: ectoine synthase [unclassified Ruegeria]|uniref:ectoine synthase n=1 Tax=unclassified Ruegeria TaxID=2625375 RepID=UPI00148881BE|nr:MULTISPECIES: ectoine synthase [unclassified Ruegeria]NOD64931.1 ectoine synthase [Ruegeria sp. HKCCD6109]
MIVKTLKDVLGSDHDVSGTGWNSRRLLIAKDGMGFSLTDTIIKKGAALDLEYTHHFEACYCISGKGQIRAAGDETWHALEPFTLYALDQHDRHVVRATETDLRLVCVFNPPLSGREVHREDGSYAAPETESSVS